MYNPTTRLLSILELLQSHGEMSAGELARKLEVQERSIRRYIQMLRDIGIPIESERGPYGGYMLRPGFRLPPLMFNHDEIVAVMVGLGFVRELSSTSQLAVESVTAKIERVLPDELRQRSTALKQTLTIFQAQSSAYPIADDLLLTFSLAAFEERCLFISYEASSGDITERIISPYGVVLHGKSWYLAAYCHLREALRTFRLERVRAVKSNDAVYVENETINPAVYVLNALAMMPGTYAFEVKFDAPIDTVAHYVPAAMGILEAAGDQTLMRCYSDDAYWFARWLAQIEIPFIVHQTDELRHALRMIAQQLVESTEK